MKQSLRFRFLLVLVFSWRAVLAQVQSFPHYEVSALVAFKRAAFEDPFSALSDWDSVDGNPCSWTGVTCSANRDCVVSLNLSGSSLKGFLTPELKSLGCLQELHLNNNLLLGTIPAEIGMLKNLTVLDLSMNRLTGPIPPILGELTAVNKLDLHSNGLTGSIPPELGKLENLVELRLDRNKLGGQIPGGSNLNVSATSYSVRATDSKSSGLCQLSKLRMVDFSYNFLVGQIPSCLKYRQRSSFQGNCFQDKFTILQRTTKSCRLNKNQSMAKERKKQSTGESDKHQSPQQPEWLLILEVTTGFLVVVFVITGIATAVRTCRLKTLEKIRWKKTMSWKDEMAISIDGDMLKNVPRFSREELEIACEDFSNIIGTSPHSMVYKGTMKDSTEVAVISLCNLEDQWTNYLELSFHNKVADLARLDHENLAKLLGYCKESEPFSRMLVLGYASNGTLYEHLHYGDGSQLSWIRRMKIILGVARGLRYLHTELQPPFVLSKMSSNAVYLTEEFSPKLVDFESWKIIFSESKKSIDYSNGVSIPGYNVPREQQEMEIQANIFAFGVVLLEIISGRPPYCKERGCLINWATKYLQNPEELSKLVDPELKNVKSQDLVVVCSAVSLCIEPDPTKRPSVQIITDVLENGIDLSAAALLKESPLAWAELALSS